MESRLLGKYDMYSKQDEKLWLKLAIVQLVTDVHVSPMFLNIIFQI